MSEYILELTNITKIFPGVKALNNVSFQLKSGEIHALMGENGAGKSTFIKVITGINIPEYGEIFFNGEKVQIKGPKDAQKLGIAAIYQHGTCYPDLSVTENIFIGHEKVTKVSKKICWKEMHLRADELLKELSADFDSKTRMGALSVAQQQIVEIAKALSTEARIIIMDEPTAALTKRESEELYKITEKLRDSGVSIIFISHRFEDMYRLASRVTVLRDSKYIGTWNIDGISNEDLIVAMVGREITQLFPEKKARIGEEVLSAKGLSRIGYFDNIDFYVRKGEILGITGLVGAGRTEVFQALFGITKLDKGEIFLDGNNIKINDVLDAIKLGIGYLPEDRQKEGLILEWSIGRNITLAAIDKFSKKGFIEKEEENKISNILSNKLNIKSTSINELVSSLSGGNQQKVVVAKLLTMDLKVIILDEPTKGVDVGAKSAIYEIMNTLAEQGYGIIMISSEMPEILGMSDRILVMREGKVTKIFNKSEATQEAILEMAMSAKIESVLVSDVN